MHKMFLVISLVSRSKMWLVGCLITSVFLLYIFTNLNHVIVRNQTVPKLPYKPTNHICIIAKLNFYDYLAPLVFLPLILAEQHES